MKTNKINIAVIGLGNIGSYFFKSLNANKKEIFFKTGKLPVIKYVSAKRKKKEVRNHHGLIMGMPGGGCIGIPGGGPRIGGGPPAPLPKPGGAPRGLGALLLRAPASVSGTGEVSMVTRRNVFAVCCGRSARHRVCCLCISRNICPTNDDRFQLPLSAG